MLQDALEDSLVWYTSCTETVREAGQLDARALSLAPPHESPMFTTNKRPYGEVEQVGKREILLRPVI